MSQKIIDLLNSIKPIIAKNDEIKKQQYDRGELFNIFSVMNAESDEVRTHSSIIAELLNPNGSHGLHDKFLKLFLTIVGYNDEQISSFVLEKTVVETEKSIGEISVDYTMGGRLDII